jgi:predicted dehydrogenase
MKPELGGGALLDAGSYPMSLIRLVMGSAPPQRVGRGGGRPPAST